MNYKYIQSSITLLVTLHLTLSSETNAPVYEVVNEQARIDENIRLSNNPVILPYGNPLAGNSKQNARLHASNQQAMFNAERIRQHKAQIQRWNKGPMDSYMKAYHELQENHQLEIEQQQATLKDSPVTASPSTSPRPRTKQRVQNKRVPNNDDSQNERQPTKRVQNQRKELPRRVPQRIDPVKFSKGDALKDIRNRNHRSYGSSVYNQQLEPKRYQTVYVYPVTSFDQGIAVKPNSDIGSTYPVIQPSKLYTKAISSDTKPTYAKQLDHKFTSVQEIEALNSLLAKNPEQQLTEFTALVNSDRNEEINKDVPADLYYYLKNPTQMHNIYSSKSVYASAYVPVIKDHTPITEDIDDIEEPNNKQTNSFSESTGSPKIETATTKSNNYYKVEVASETVKDNNPYLLYGLQSLQENSDKSERYLHHNAQTTGLQHLLEDGTETSAYEDNVSRKVRSKRSKLETEPFLSPEKKANTTDTPTSEALIRLNPFNKKRDSLDVYLPNFQIGEASYDYDFDYNQSNQKLNSFYDDDYYDDYDFGPNSQNFGPSGYQSEVQGSFSNRLHHFRRVPLSSIYGTPPSTSYGVPFYGSLSHFGSHQSYSPHKFESTGSSISFDNLEPVYMLTQSQLKELIGHHNLNIGHLDVYQLNKENKGKKYSYPRKYRKRYPYRHVQKNLFKLHKFNS